MTWLRFRAWRRSLLERPGVPLAGNSFADYDVAESGDRFVMFPSAADADERPHPHVTLVTHWFDELDHTFATGN